MRLSKKRRIKKERIKKEKRERKKRKRKMRIKIDHVLTKMFYSDTGSEQKYAC